MRKDDNNHGVKTKNKQTKKKHGISKHLHQIFKNSGVLLAGRKFFCGRGAILDKKIFLHCLLSLLPPEENSSFK